MINVEMLILCIEHSKVWRRAKNPQIECMKSKVNIN